MLSRKVMASGARVDPNFKNVTLLLHGDGTNGGQNNTFIDGSSNNFTITRNGNTTQGSFNPYGNLWSNYFDGSGDYLQWTGTAIGSGDFTAECWVKPQALPGTNKAVIGSASANTSAGWEIYIQNNVFAFYSNGANVILTTTTLTVNNWYHVAAVRSGSTLRIYINGVDSGNATFTGNLTNTTFYVSWDFASQAINAYISNVRHVVGTAVYTAAFTPPTTNLTAIANTSVLTCQSNRFVDNSTNNYTITRNGDTKVTSFAPFSPTSVYTTGQGASGYFDGTDYVTVSATAFGTNSLTMECWVYFTATPSSTYILGEQLNSYQMYVEGGTARVYSGAGMVLNSTSTITAGQWIHLALVRNGSTLTIYVNGENKGSTTNSTNFTATTYYVGTASTQPGNATYSVSGYISDARIVIGTAVYTANFTPPTSPLTAITNTNFLCNFKNAAIFDSTARTVLETTGNAQIDTGTKKFGTGSLKFDGNGDSLKFLLGPTGANADLGSGDYTIEFWINANSWSATTVYNIANIFTPVDVGYGLSGAFQIQSDPTFNNAIILYNFGGGSADGVVVSTPLTSVTTGVWYHMAFTRASGTTRMFVDGVLKSSSSKVYTGVYGTNPLYIGAGPSNGWFNGYIDEFRLTKGYARYTANFTPPTLPFPDK